jgi:hypothetical protein
MKRLLVVAALAASLGSASSSHATTLTFNGFNTSNAATYGDNINQAVVGGITYLEGDGFTPDIALTFKPDAPFSQYSLWPSGYGGTLMVNALGHGSFNVPGEIIFTPSGGAKVTLRGFDIATWSGGSYQTDIRIWDDAGSRAAPNLFSFNQILNPFVVYQPLSAPVTAVGALHLYINNLGSTGLDNVNFTQTLAIPEPEMTAMLLAGLGLVGAVVRRRRSRQ